MIFLRNVTMIMLVMTITGIGCSHDASPVEPCIKEIVRTSESNSHNLWGLYTFTCDPGKGTVEVIPLREADMHLNVIGLLEPPALLYLTLESAPHFEGNILDVDIGIRNPYVGYNRFTGFDVCGIIITHGNDTLFGSPNLVVPSDSDTRLLNRDGWTRWWNPEEFPHGGTLFNYQDGLLGTPADEANLDSTLNGYKYYADGLEKDDPLTVLDPSDRCIFSAGKKNVRHYTIALDDGLVFNYAIDACWKKPTGTPPYSVPDDFPPDANRPEAWNVVVTELENTLYHDDNSSQTGGELVLQVDVWDHYNSEDNLVRIYSPAGFELTESSTPTGGGDGYSTYEFTFSGDNLTKNGPIVLYIAVRSGEMGYGSTGPDKPVTSYFEYMAYVGPVYPYDGWVLTWGSHSEDGGYGVCIDDADNIYVTGEFANVCDFDPSSGVDKYYPHKGPDGGYGSNDAYLIKFNSSGVYQWVRTWGDIRHEYIQAIAYDPGGYIYVLGEFYGVVDFDPGPGVYYLQSPNVADGGKAIFLSKFDVDGNFIWAKTWGGYLRGPGHGIEVDSLGYVYVTGIFEDIVDFDPGTGTDAHESAGYTDAFLSKFSPSGNYQWGRTWGGLVYDEARDLAIDGDDNIYVAGFFYGVADFNPGPEIDEHFSNGEVDIFLSKFDADGDYQWAATWGGPAGWPVMEAGLAVCVDDENFVYVTGVFGETADFDPGPGVDEHASNGEYDAFLTKLDSDAIYQWARTWGGDFEWDAGFDVIADGSEYVYVTGRFGDTVDFDPGDGVDIQSSHGEEDFSISKFSSDGEYEWARTWGGEDEDLCANLALDSFGNVFATGYFGETVDFNPGPDVEEHTVIDDHSGTDAFLLKILEDGLW